MDYKEPHFIHQACTPIGRVTHWHSADSSKARVLVKVLIDNMTSVPRVIKLNSGRALNGEGRSWLVRIFILNSQFADQIIDDDEDDFPNNGNNGNGGNLNDEELQFVVNLANNHQQQGNVQLNQNQQNNQAHHDGEDSGNSSVNQASMDQEMFVPGTGSEKVLVLEPIGAHKGGNQMTIHPAGQKERSSDSYNEHYEIEKQLQAMDGDQPHPNKLIPRLAYLLADNLRVFLQKIQDNQAHGTRQSVILDAPKFKLNMRGSNIESVQVILESNSMRVADRTINLPESGDAVDDRATENMVEEGGNTINPAYGPTDLDKNTDGGRMIIDGPEKDTTNKMEMIPDATDPTTFELTAQPIKKVYIRKRKKGINQSKNKQTNTKQVAKGMSKTPTTSNKISFSDMSDQVTNQLPRRSIRINKKNNGCKDRSILDATGGKCTKASKKRKVTSLKELNAKLIIPTATLKKDFPGLADLENGEPFPEISITTIQEVATARCGLSPMEVTQELK